MRTPIKLLALALTLSAGIAVAQDKQEVMVKNDGDKITVTIVKEVNGEKTTTEKTFNSKEEMKNDPDLKDMNIFIMDSGSMGNWHHKNADGDVEKKVEVIVNGDVDEEKMKEIMERMEKHQDGEHNAFFFKSDGDVEKEVDVKVFTDEDGKVQILKDGKVVEGNTWTDEEGNTFDLEKDGKHIIIKGDGATVEFFGEGDVDLNKLHHGDGTVHVEGKDGEEVRVFVKKIGGDDVVVEGDHEGEVRVIVKKFEYKIHVEEVAEQDFENLLEAKSKQLAFDELNVFPNPSSGMLNLQFVGNDKPTSISIRDLNGKEVYSENLKDFAGSYNQEIDLRDVKQGMYLLQIRQGNKAVNKKIVVE